MKNLKEISARLEIAKKKVKKTAKRNRSSNAASIGKAFRISTELVAAVVVGTSVTVTVLWVVLFFLSSKRTFQVPKVFAILITKLGKERGEKYLKQTNGYIEEVCTMSRENLGSPKSKRVFTVGFITSIISWVYYGISFMIIAKSVGY